MLGGNPDAPAVSGIFFQFHLSPLSESGEIAILRAQKGRGNEEKQCKRRGQHRRVAFAKMSIPLWVTERPQG